MWYFVIQSEVEITICATDQLCVKINVYVIKTPAYNKQTFSTMGVVSQNVSLINSCNIMQM